MLEWIIENIHVIADVATIVAVGGLWAWLRYRGNQDRLYADLWKLLDEALESLEDWAGDQIDSVTIDDVYMVADAFYDRFIAGTVLEGLVGRQRFADLLWEAFRMLRGRQEIEAAMRSL